MASLDPSNPERMVACSMPFDPEGNDIRTALYVTFDGGRSWAFSKDIYPAGDPACAYATDGTLLFTGLARDTIDVAPRSERPYHNTFETWPKTKGMRLYRSPDGGRTWEEPTDIGFIDNQNFLIDRTGGTYHGRVYI